MVMAKCPGYGLNQAAIGKIDDKINKKNLQEILADEKQFPLMVANYKSCVSKKSMKVAEKVSEKSPKPKISKKIEKKTTETADNQKIKLDTLKEQAKLMPFAQNQKSSQNKNDVECGEEATKNTNRKESYLEMITNNVRRNHEKLKQLGLNQLQNNPEKAVVDKKKRKSDDISPKVNKKEEGQIRTKSKRFIQSTVSVSSNNSDLQNVVVNDEEKVFDEEVSDEEKSDEDVTDEPDNEDNYISMEMISSDEDDSSQQSGCVCENCPYKEELQKYKLRETIKTGGIIDAETAREKKMLELVPNSGVFIPLAVKTLIFEGSRSRSTLAAKLMRTLYTTEELKSVRKASDLKNADIIIPAIIACCLRYSGATLPKIDKKILKKSISNVVTYENRDYKQMMTKRRQKKEQQKLANTSSINEMEEMEEEMEEETENTI